MGVKKLPKVKELQTEYAKLLEEKKKTYAESVSYTHLDVYKRQVHRSEIRLQGTYRIYRRGKAKFGIADV